MTLFRKFLLVLIFLTLSAVTAMAGQVDEAIVMKMISEYGLDSGEYDVEIIANHLDVTSLTTDELSFQPISNKEPLGLFTVLAAVERDGKIISKGQVRVKIRKFENVVVADDKFSRHDMIDATKLVLKRMEVTSLLQQPVKELDGLENFRARLLIRKDQIITTNLIEPVPDIEVGHEVTIILESHLMQITAPGRSMESGSKGDEIRVKNNATGKIIVARVVSQNSVKVEL
jgi:flagella basal body P-ring formation protein FlgA